MNYCIRYNNKSEQLDNVAEVSIIYDGQDKSLVDYLAANYLKRTVLRVSDMDKFVANEEWRKLNAIKQQYPHYNFAICFETNGMLRRDLLEQIDALACDWFTDYPVTDWDKLHFFAAIGVSDMYIAEALGFELPEVSKFCRTRNIKIRVWPNVAQHSVKILQPLRSFFIRPEDLKHYEPYIDTIEFWGPVEKQDILLRIYRETKAWPYDLSILITGLESAHAQAVPAIFGKVRVSCGKACLRGEQCNICGHVSTLTKLVKELNINIKPL